MPRAKINYIPATFDTETDPFKYGRVPRPFACEFYSDQKCFVAWGDDCIARFAEFLENEATEGRIYLIYAHNGGKFDFHYLHQYIDNPIKIINGRIVHATMFGHVIRDSFAIIPIPLKAFNKDDIDYDKMERHSRERHKDEILAYLHVDCISLYQLIAAFIERFGPVMTVGSTAMQQIMLRHEFDRMSPEGDAYFRKYYYGGRVQCFKSGILTNGPWKAYDVNSMYPKVMRDFKHPVNAEFDCMTTMPDNFDKPFFMSFHGTNKGALPMRPEHGIGLEFNRRKGDFFACSHEIEVALKYNLIDIHEIYECYVAVDTISFVEYVDHFYNEKVIAKQAGDKIGELFAKFMLNSGYGKFGQNPENFSDWYVNRDFGNDDSLSAKGFEMKCEYDDFELWSKPAKIKDSAYYDVSIAASITSGARAIMLEGIQQANEPLYCDTDSLICREFHGNISDTTLGSWKHEFTTPAIAIAGKKLYMAYDPEKEWNTKGRSKNSPDLAKNTDPFDARKPENPIKLVTKGGTLRPDDVLAICNGRNVEYANDAPTFSIKRKPTFVSRNFKMTVDRDSHIWQNENVEIDETPI